MPTVSPEAALAALRWRYAVKAFDPAGRIDPALWAYLEQAVTLAPSSYGLQPWKFVVVTDPAVRAELRPAAWGQSQVTDASHLVVFCARKPPTPADVERFIARVAEVRGSSPGELDGYKGMILGTLSKMSPEQAHAWAARQAYIALGVFLSAAALVGVDACPMEGFRAEQFDEILGLKAQGYGSVVLAAAGYRSEGDKYAHAPKVRFGTGEVIDHV